MDLMCRQLKAGSESVIMDAFNAWDSEGRGDISTKELRSMLMRLPERLKKQDVDEMMSLADPKSRGRIKFSGTYVLLLSRL
jgi:Ca2+-binding EF-hand superfamily protein